MKILDSIKRIRIKKDSPIQFQIDDDAIQVKVDRVGMIAPGLEGVLLLKSEDGIEFPIYAFSGEVARSIAGFKEDVKENIPSIYGLVEQLAEELETRLVKVRIFDNMGSLRANLYFAGKKNVTLRNYRASDAIALATYYKVPILLKKELAEQKTEQLR